MKNFNPLRHAAFRVHDPDEPTGGAPVADPPAPIPDPTPAPPAFDEAAYRQQIEAETRERLEQEYRDRQPQPQPAAPDPTAPPSWDERFYGDAGVNGYTEDVIQEATRRMMQALGPVLNPVVQNQNVLALDPSGGQGAHKFVADMERQLGRPLNLSAMSPGEQAVMRMAYQGYQAQSVPVGAVPTPNPGNPVPAAAPQSPVMPPGFQPQPMSPEPAHGSPSTALTNAELADPFIAKFAAKYGADLALQVKRNGND